MPKTLNKLKPDEFESLIFDLCQKLGIKNCVWRTPGRDCGRDIQGEYYVQDISGYLQQQNWYIECKRYTKSVDWPTVWEKVSYAESNSADVLLFVTSSSLSPQAVDEVNKWNVQKKRLTIRFWGGVDIESKLRLFPDLSIKYRLSDDPKKDKALALFPIVKILLKYSDAAHSAHVFSSSDLERKLTVVHALSELLTNRTADLENEGKLIVHKYRDKVDNYDWFVGGDSVEKYGLDRYAFRALICYLFDVQKESTLTINDSNQKLVINFKKNISDYVVRDIIDITLLSNIRLYVKESVLTLEVI